MKDFANRGVKLVLVRTALGGDSHFQRTNRRKWLTELQDTSKWHVHVNERLPECEVSSKS